MSAPTSTTVPGTAKRLTASRISGLRRSQLRRLRDARRFQFALGIYVNLYVTVPNAEEEDHGHR